MIMSYFSFIPGEKKNLFFLPFLVVRHCGAFQNGKLWCWPADIIAYVWDSLSSILNFFLSTLIPFAICQYPFCLKQIYSETLLIGEVFGSIFFTLISQQDRRSSGGSLLQPLSVDSEFNSHCFLASQNFVHSSLYSAFLARWWNTTYLLLRLKLVEVQKKFIYLKNHRNFNCIQQQFNERKWETFLLWNFIHPTSKILWTRLQVF